MRSSIEISTTTTSGCIVTRRRATSIPLTSGMRTSSSTRSGERRPTASIPASPPSASPTDSNPFVAAITSRAIARKIA